MRRNMNISNIYRDVTLDSVSESDVGKNLKLAGWVENIRDHGGVSFIDLRDMYGVMQVVMRDTTLLDGISKEDCISIEGVIEHRDEETYNPKIPTGTIELEAHKVEILGRVYKQLPFEIMTSKETREDVRLKYRYLDLRNAKVRDNMLFRSNVISFLRQKMTEMGFLEIQTPILCASSPEGARDYIVPSRKFKGKFYALPQAPQQYKQLLMVSGFDKYFQIAPCFRDEDARADRSPGEFYQLDFEMAFRIGARAVRRTASKVQYLLERDALSESDKNALKRKNKLRITVSRAIDILPCRNDCKRNICPAGVELVYVVNNGDIFPCASVKKKAEFKIGNIGDIDILKKWYLFQTELDGEVLCQ